jgi:2,5-diketo-D-gluconate reductase A
MNAQSKIELKGGNKMPVMGLGTWQLRGEDCLRSISTALELGYRMIDTASDYHNHTEVGRAINSSRVPRNGIYLVTKIEEYDDAYQATEQYLEELGQEYTNLMLIHRPPESGVGVDLWQGLIDAKQAGLARDIGVSNYSIEQIQELFDATGELPAVNQIEWSPFGHDMEMLKFCREQGIQIQAYSPLTRQERLHDDTIEKLAQKYGKTPAQIMIRWNIEHKVVPIVKATSRQHLKENIDIFDFELGNDDVKQMDNFNEHYSSLGSRLQYVE